MSPLRAYRYELPMRPIRLAGRLYTQRTGIVLCDAATERHWGEAAPLPGFSRESLDDVVRGWRKGPPYSSPSLRFALETIEDSVNRAQGSEVSSAVIPLNGLLGGTATEMLEGARELSRQGYPTVKMKVGPQTGTIVQCADTVRRVRDLLRSDQRLRLDANRGWGLPDAIQFGKLLEPASVEYCEEPTHSPEDLEAFFGETGVRYALDETLREQDDLEAFRNAAALVVKPMLHGGRQALAPLLSYGIPLVFSGTFETAVGTLQVARLAHQYSPQVPAGLDSYSWLVQDIVSPRLVIRDGWLEISQRPVLDREMLQELTP